MHAELRDRAHEAGVPSSLVHELAGKPDGETLLLREIARRLKAAGKEGAKAPASKPASSTEA